VKALAIAAALAALSVKSARRLGEAGGWRRRRICNKRWHHLSISTVMSGVLNGISAARERKAAINLFLAISVMKEASLFNKWLKLASRICGVSWRSAGCRRENKRREILLKWHEMQPISIGSYRLMTIRIGNHLQHCCGLLLRETCSTYSFISFYRLTGG